MRNNNCEVIRRELDELMLDETCSAVALEHLRECAACREFHQKQTKLRQIVGGLGTVSAPPDFDFRLRARLANDASSASFHLTPAYWSFARRGLAVAAVLIVFAAGIALVRNVMNRQEVAVKEQPVVVQPPAPKPSVESLKTGNPLEFSAAIPKSSPQKKTEPRLAQTIAKNRRSAVAVDFSSERADIINGSLAASTAFPIDASLQSLKVSLDDGRGNARTIFVPTITFGSQRMLQGGNQFTPKGVW
ncbi:MAG TPA: hypothetical protein VI031_06670 [Pyrinomonadaceae bacterium]